MKKSLVITGSVAVAIAVAAAATLFVLSAFAGQRSGIDHSRARDCAALSQSEVRAVSGSDYGKKLERFARCKARAGR